jgi:MFS family permease
VPPVRFRVLAFLCLIALIAYVQRAALSVPAGDIARDLGVGMRELSYVMTAWYVGYAVFQLPSGWLADRWGSCRGLAVFAVGWSLLTALAGVAPDYASLMTVWFAMGMAQAGVFPCSTKALGAWFPDAQRARAVGALACSMQLGITLGPMLAGTLLEGLDTPDESISAVTLHPWQRLLLLYAVPGLAWVIAYVAIVPPAPTHLAAGRAAGPVDWRVLLTSWPMALLCTQQFLRAMALAFFVTWFPKFLQEARGVPQLQSGLLTGCAASGSIIGGLVGGTVSDLLLERTGNRRLSRQGIAVIGMAVSSGLIVAAYFVADVYLAILLISLGTFAAAFGGISGYTVCIEFGGSRVATVFSLMNMCGNIGAALFPLLVAQLVEHTGNWDLALFLFAGCFAAAGVCWALLNPLGTLFEEAHESC